MVAAVLLDTRSIQKYVFGCNELKTNVGASYIVDKIFEELLAEKILKKYRQGENLELDWKNNKTKLCILFYYAPVFKKMQ